MTSTNNFFLISWDQAVCPWHKTWSEPWCLKPWNCGDSMYSRMIDLYFVCWIWGWFWWLKNPCNTATSNTSDRKIPGFLDSWQSYQRLTSVLKRRPRLFPAADPAADPNGATSRYQTHLWWQARAKIHWKPFDLVPWCFTHKQLIESRHHISNKTCTPPKFNISPLKRDHFSGASC